MTARSGRSARPGGAHRGCLARLLGIGSPGPPVDAAVRTLRVIVPSTVAPGERLPAEVQALDGHGREAAGFAGHLQVICVTADGRAERLGDRPMTSPHLHLDDLRVEGAGVARLVVTDLVSGVGGMSNPFEVVDDPHVPRIWWVRLAADAGPDSPAPPWLIDMQPGHADLKWLDRVAGHKPGAGWLLGVAASAGDPAAVRASIRAGAFYVTTGARILLRVSLAGGVRARVSGTALLRGVAMVKNAAPVHAVEPGSLDAEIAVPDEAFDPRAPGDAWWVAIEQSDGARAWSRPTGCPPA